MIIFLSIMDSLLAFLEEINDDFTPKLSEKVCLKEYINKLRERANLIYKNKDNKIIGLVVLYCNDKQTNIGYVALCGVLKKWRGKGFARDLMKQAIKKSRAAGMKKIGIHSNNPIAINLYKDLGFKIIKNDDRAYLELVL